MEAKNSPPPSPLISRTELFWLAGAVIFGAILRLGYPGRTAIEHFDEGVYASNFWFGPENHYSYPMRHLYAPPLVPAAIEWTMILASLCRISPNGFIPMIPSLIAGIVTIPSIWWIGRRWFGPTAGLFSAWLVATSDFHACYSRAAMTDVPVCLFILWAVYFIWNAYSRIDALPYKIVERGKRKSAPKIGLPWRDIFLAGGFTGLAWWTKYNGWLPLAIGLAGGTLWQFVTPKEQRQVRRMLTCWSIIATISALVWSPVLWDLQSKDGYASVAANHRQYIVGLNGWPRAAARQIQNVGMYDNLCGLLTEPFGTPTGENSELADLGIECDLGSIAVSLSILFTEPGAVTSYSRIVTKQVFELTHGIATYLVPLGLFLIAAIAFVFNLRRTNPSNSRVAVCLASAWFCGMTFATPLYHPYPRLVFPWLFSVWLGVSLAIEIWLDRYQFRQGSLESQSAKTWSPSRLELFVLAWLISNCVVRSLLGTSHAFQDRAGLQKAANLFSRVIAEQLAVSIESEKQSAAEKEAVALVWGDPAMVFGLRANRVAYVFPVQGLNAIDQPTKLKTFFVFGKQSYESPEYSASWRKLDQCQFRELDRFRPSHLVFMDSYQGDVDFDHFFDRGTETSPERPSAWIYEIVK